MIKVEIKGLIEEIIYKSDKSCKFLVTDGCSQLLSTITNRNIELTHQIAEGEKYKFSGEISAYTKTNDKGKFIDNVFYVNEVELLEELEV